MKKMWDDQGDKVLYIKSLRFEKGKKGATSLIPRSLKERYEQLFQVEDLKKEHGCQRSFGKFISSC